MTANTTLRSRVKNLLRTARSMGQAGVAVATLATVLGSTPESVLVSVMPEMMDGAIHYDVNVNEPALVPQGDA